MHEITFPWLTCLIFIYTVHYIQHSGPPDVILRRYGNNMQRYVFNLCLDITTFGTIGYVTGYIIQSVVILTTPTCRCST